LLSKSTLLKANWYALKEEEAVVIDSNERMVAKIGQISNALKTQTEDEFADDFSEGIQSVQVAALLADDEESNIIKQEEISSRIEADAAEMMAQTRQEIDAMYESAQAEIERLKAEAVERGIEEGRELGYQEGYQHGTAQIAAMEAELLQQYADKETKLNDMYQRKLEEMEPELINTLTGIYEHIFRVDLSEQRNIIVHLISTTLHRVEGSSNYIIRVSTEDYPFVSMQKQSVLEMCISSGSTMEVVEDVTLSRNECLIETDTGIYDCGVGTELKELKKELRLLSYEK